MHILELVISSWLSTLLACLLPSPRPTSSSRWLLGLHSRRSPRVIGIHARNANGSDPRLCTTPRTTNLEGFHVGGRQTASGCEETETVESWAASQWEGATVRPTFLAEAGGSQHNESGSSVVSVNERAQRSSGAAVHSSLLHCALGARW